MNNLKKAWKWVATFQERHINIYRGYLIFGAAIIAFFYLGVLLLALEGVVVPAVKIRVILTAPVIIGVLLWLTRKDNWRKVWYAPK